MTPTGAIRTTNPQNGPFGIDWAMATQWEDEARAACDQFGPPLSRVMATVVIESGGRSNAVQRNPDNGDSYGLMQIVPFGVDWNGWHSRVKQIANLSSNAPASQVRDALFDPLTNLRVGCSILRDLHIQHGTWDRASSVFFLGVPKRGAYWDGQDTVNGNTGEGYRRSLSGLIAEYGEAGGVADPIIYDLARNADAARFGLTAQERDYLLGRRTANRNGASIQAIGLHVQWGNTTGSLDWWVNGPGVAASSTIMVQQDGSILRVIPEHHAPWTQGDVKGNISARVRNLRSRFGNDPNMWSLTIEAEDQRTERINAAQEKTIAWQIRQWQAKYPQLAGSDWEDRILGHYEINAVDRVNCGKYRDAMVASLRTGAPPPDPEPPPDPIPGLPAWLTEGHVKAAFPDFSRDGIVSQALVRYIAKSGTLPVYRERREAGEKSSLWLFDRVTIIHEGTNARYEGESA